MSELKIVLKTFGDGKVITAEDSQIFVDDEPIGWIQKVNFDISINTLPVIEITFPDTTLFNSELNKNIPFQKDIDKLSQFANVSIKCGDKYLRKVKITYSDDILSEEFSSDKYIENTEYDQIIPFNNVIAEESIEPENTEYLNDKP